MAGRCNCDNVQIGHWVKLEAFELGAIFASVKDGSPGPEPKSRTLPVGEVQTSSSSRVPLNSGSNASHVHLSMLRLAPRHTDKRNKSDSQTRTISSLPKFAPGLSDAEARLANPTQRKPRWPWLQRSHFNMHTDQQWSDPSMMILSMPRMRSWFHFQSNRRKVNVMVKVLRAASSEGRNEDEWPPHQVGW